MIIVGQHRNLRLAKRHLAQLRRDYAPQAVRIVSRRNAAGVFSVRGQFFYFRISKVQEPERVELVLHFDYQGGKENSKILRIQVHVIIPYGFSDGEILDRLQKDYQSGKEHENLPDDWEIKKITWGKVISGDSETKVTRPIEEAKYLADIAIPAAQRRKVLSRTRARKPSVRENRRTRKGSPKK